MPNEELKRRFELVDNQNYKALREEWVNYIVEKANSPMSSELIRGMLLLINESDSWETDYITVCERAKKGVQNG